MKFTYDNPNARIDSDDPEIWVEDCGVMRERGHGFVLRIRGKKIGFEEVSRSSERRKGPNENSISWTIDKIGGPISKWDAKSKRDLKYAYEYQFESVSEQAEVTELIRQSLAVFLDIFGKYNVEHVYVSFTDRLEQQLSSGVLIK